MLEKVNGTTEYVSLNLQRKSILCSLSNAETFEI